MHAASLLQFESQLEHGSALKALWEEVKPQINEGNLKSRESAYVLFSNILKISQQAVKQEKIKDLWLNLLEQGNFSLCLEGKEPLKYRFNTIIDLVNSSREAFKVEILEVDPKKSDLKSVSEAIHSVALDSLGRSPGASFFEQLMTSQNTLCLLAQEGKTPVACTYGTYVETPQVNVFHINFLGRKVEYPSIHILEKLQREVKRIQNRFPNVHYLTLCVHVQNQYMIPIYEGLGFEKITYIEKDAKEEARYFYGKKMDPNSNVEPPIYQEFKTALDAQREKEKSTIK